MKHDEPLVIIGRCVAVGYLDDKGERTMDFPKSKLLAWKGPKKGGDLIIVTDCGKLPGDIAGNGARGRYANFHGHDPTMMREVDWERVCPGRIMSRSWCGVTSKTLRTWSSISRC